MPLQSDHVLRFRLFAAIIVQNDGQQPLIGYYTPTVERVSSWAALRDAVRNAPEISMIKLNCPSCNGTLELPDGLGVAHCVYCGAKILLQQTDGLREKQNLDHYIELAKVALESNNYEEAIRYCNSILEIDPSYVQAWIDKAIGTFWLTTGAHNRYSEALGYLRKAAQIAPDDKRITDAHEELKRLQAWWYNKLGNDALALALKIWNIYEGDTWAGGEAAAKNTLEHFLKAMDHYLMALNFDPDDIDILGNVAYCKQKGWWISWSDAVHDKLKILEMLRAKQLAEKILPKLGDELASAQATLAKLKTEGGLFVNVKIKAAEANLKRIQAEIADQERAYAFEVPTD